MNEKSFSKNISQKAARMLRAKRIGNRNGVWFGLGMMGLVGWSVVVPTLLGAMLGVWIDNRETQSQSSNYSWTLMLLIIGLIIGCLNAWRWVAKEQQEMREDREDNNG
ncbi:MAG: F0F1 ATP synthase subunit [Bdellovibrio sp. CG10_big_fil_rev_8_21_14_0_10_47_8]|nr:MAG: F0F1 ATP synthase subunit [Bdellovibrio sp. CG10_big_fil_rev_8_21_14_0_10_47_8]